VSEIEEAVERAALSLRTRLGGRAPTLLLTLGSGLGAVADRIEDAVDVPVAAIPGLTTSTVPGHAGLLRFGRLGDREVMASIGRIHLYEGHSPHDVVRTVDVAAALGCDTSVVTNAAGGLDPTLRPGDLLLITDHLNLTGVSPLTGRLRDGAPVFLDMAGAYDAVLRDLAVEVAEARGERLRAGVYAGLPGPAYETPAEVAMLRTLGADAVGMSTVLEVIAARSHGMRVLGLSSITNVHGEGVATSHGEVLEVGAEAAVRLGQLLLDLLPRC
jgi:purine-nucleoside phosphorylase